MVSYHLVSNKSLTCLNRVSFTFLFTSLFLTSAFFSSLLGALLTHQTTKNFTLLPIIDYFIYSITELCDSGTYLMCVRFLPFGFPRLSELSRSQRSLKVPSLSSLAHLCLARFYPSYLVLTYLPVTVTVIHSKP